MGLSSGVYFTAGNPLVSELFPDRVGRALGIHGMANQLAAVAAPALVGVVLVLGSWRLAFAGASVAACVVTLVLYVVSGRMDLPDAGAGDREFLDATRTQWPLICTGIVILGTAGLVWQGVFNFYVSYLIVEKGLTEGTARNLLIVVFAAGVPAFFVTGWLADRFAPLPLLFTVIASFVCCVLVFTTLSGVLALAAMSAVLGYVVHGLFPAMDTFLLGSLPDDHRASAYSVYSGGMMLTQATGSSVVGVLVDQGLRFTTVFRGLAGTLALVLCALVGLYLTNQLPTGATPTARTPADD
jgi:predicted MFS family arabinose efflux permease